MSVSIYNDVVTQMPDLTSHEESWIGSAPPS